MNVTDIMAMVMPMIILDVKGSPNTRVPTSMAVIGSKTPRTDAFVAPILRVATASVAVEIIVGRIASPIRFIQSAPVVIHEVIGVPDKKYGEEAMACIILKEGKTMTVEEMHEYIVASMARHKVPKYIEFVNSFPMNAAGKVLKYKMREEATKRLGLENAAGIDTAKSNN